MVLGEALAERAFAEQVPSGDVNMADNDGEQLDDAEDGDDHVADPINALLSNVKLRADDDAWADLDAAARELISHLEFITPPPKVTPLPALLTQVAKCIPPSEFKPLVPMLPGKRPELEGLLADMKVEYEARKRVLIHQLHITLSFLLPDKPDLYVL